jgi:hypothetical protein
MKPIVAALLHQFKKSQELDNVDTSSAFEQLVTYCALSAERLDQGDFRDALTDAGEQGIDAVAILVNGRLVSDPSEVDELARKFSRLQVSYVFCQAKTSERWDAGDVLKFTRAVDGFFDDTDIGTSSVVATAREIHAAILRHIAQLDENPRVSAYYATTGTWDENSQAAKLLGELHDKLVAKAYFSTVRCEPIDAARIQRLYRSATAPPTATVEFVSKVTLPSISGVDQAYLGVLPATELMKLLEDSEDGSLRRSVFEDNVRDFQGSDNPVNSRIRETLRGEHRERFAILNNGVTVVVRDLQVTGNTFRLRDYQVVNGAQTSNVLFENRDALTANSNVFVPTRIIQTADEDLITAIVTATNSQTVVPEAQLNARAVAERNVERYFATTEPPRNLLYERRSKQYESSSDVIKSRVIDRRTLVRSVAAVVFDEPHLATGYAEQLMSRLADTSGKSEETSGRALFFSEDDEPIMYFAAASAYYRLDVLFRTGRLDAKYKPARWHILTVTRHLVLPGEAPSLSDKRARNWPKPLLNAVWDEKAVDLFARAAELVESTGLEMSRSALRNANATTQVLRAVTSVATDRTSESAA